MKDDITKKKAARPTWESLCYDVAVEVLGYPQEYSQEVEGEQRVGNILSS